MCQAHVHHHRLPREVQEEVTALGVALEARREPCRAGGVGGGCSSGRCGGSWRGGRGYGGHCGSHSRAGRSSIIGDSGNGYCWGLAGSSNSGVSSSGCVPRGGEGSLVPPSHPSLPPLPYTTTCSLIPRTASPSPCSLIPPLLSSLCTWTRRQLPSWGHPCRKLAHCRGWLQKSDSA